MSKLWEWLKAHYPLLVVAGAFVWSAVSIASYRRQQIPPDAKVVIRIGHWQLEPGVREALKQMSAAYRKLHPEVYIIQDAIPESTYGQWLTTQLMGGTAPDIIELGLGVPYNVLLGFYNRYFIPLSAYVNQPNPYNAGTPLEGVTWRNTYKDGMRNGYIEEMQDFMLIPLAQFGIRIFYNKDSLKKLTGLDEPPADFRGFLAVCETIKSRKTPRGTPYIPIASSAYHFGMWDGRMCDSLTFSAIRRADFNRDGAVGNDELFVAFKTGRIDLGFPPFQARLRMVRHLTDQFQSGFTGLGRDEAVFLFIQQRAVFITTGTWDAGALAEQARSVFELGIMDYPIPSRDDPEFGTIIEGPVYERPTSSFPFGITRSCPHPDVAIDFLRFIGSQAGNQELNRMIGWIPAIKDTQMPPMLQAFSPHLEGIYSAMPLTLGGDSITKWGQLYDLFKVNQISASNLTVEFSTFYRDKGRREYDEQVRNLRRAMVREEQLIAGYRYQALTTPPDQAGAGWVKYRLLTAKRLINRYLGTASQARLLEQGSTTNAVGPYEFSPETLERVRARLAAGAKKEEAGL